MNRFDQLQLQVRAQAKQIAVLEAAVAALNGRPTQTAGPPPKARRLRYVTIKQAASDGRHNLWTEYFFLKQAELWMFWPLASHFEEPQQAMSFMQTTSPKHVSIPQVKDIAEKKLKTL